MFDLFAASYLYSYLHSQPTHVRYESSPVHQWPPVPMSNEAKRILNLVETFKEEAAESGHPEAAHWLACLAECIEETS